MAARKKRTTRRRHTKRSTTAPVKKFLRKLRRQFRPLLSVLCVVLVVGVSISLCGAKKSKKNSGTVTVVQSGDYDGIDVSKYQGNIDWKKIAKNRKIKFVYIKASEGVSHVDSRYSEYISNARSAGVKVGSYHYFIGTKPAKEQFANFNRHVKKSQQDLIPMVDVEEKGNSTVSRSELQKNLAEFMRLVKNEYGKYPLLYSQYTFYKDFLSPEFDKYFLFIARYSKNPPLLDTKGKHNIWQYTEQGKIDGIDGYVDLDRFCNGTTISDISL